MCKYICTIYTYSGPKDFNRLFASSISNYTEVDSVCWPATVSGKELRSSWLGSCRRVFWRRQWAILVKEFVEMSHLSSITMPCLDKYISKEYFHACKLMAIRYGKNVALFYVYRKKCYFMFRRAWMFHHGGMLFQLSFRKFSK